MLLIPYSTFGQEGRLSFDVGCSFQLYRWHTYYYEESFDYNKHFQHGTPNILNHENKAEFSRDHDIVPRIELSYSILKRVNIIAGGYGFQREMKYRAMRWFGPYPGWEANYHEKSLFLGLIIGSEYLIINKDKHLLSFGLLATFDKIVHRSVYENSGHTFHTPNTDTFLATDALPHYDGFLNKLYGSITYEYILLDKLSIKTRLRYNPYFARSRYGQGSIFSLDVLLCYQIRNKAK